jgi:pimeloyl-ACP methyl ester carboxylesterase
MAQDIRCLVRDQLGVSGQLVLVGHDIGLMVAYAYAQTFNEDVSHLAVIDAPLPNTEVFDRLRADPRVWQFVFHSVRDIPEMLIAGREKAYLQTFFNARLYNVAAITDRELDMYASAYAAPGACGRGLSYIAPLIATSRTTERRLPNAASSQCRCSLSAVRPAPLGP